MFLRIPRFLSRRYLLATLVPVMLIAFGTAGYMVIEGWGLLDSLYMSVITLTTVGYLEVHPMSASGRIFTMLLALGGVFTLFYVTAEILRTIVGGELRRVMRRQRMEQALAEMHGHVIVCGHGRMGRQICRELSRQGRRFVVIDKDAASLEGFALMHGVAVPGDATLDDTLHRAGASRAAALIAVVGTDADNLYITMSARLLNEKLLIITRAEDERSEGKMQRAGANRVIAPYVIGGLRMAHAVVRPNVVDFIDLATRTEHLELQIEEARIARGSRLAGTTVGDCPLQKPMEVIVVAIKKAAGHMVFNPPPETKLEPGDVLIALGGRNHLDQLDRMAAGREPG